MTVKRQRQLFALLLVALVMLIGWAVEGPGWFSAPGQFEQNQPGLYRVVRFSDGDTIVVDMNGKEETVRMIGVDTPETHHPDVPVQCYGPAASAYTKDLIGQQKVRLEADPTNQNRDRYDRLLRYVYLPDGRLVEAEIIKNGYGFAYTSFPFTKKDEFVAHEQQAKTENKGLWGNCTVTEDNGRKQTNPSE
ncbi:MAG TPA: thermonuclease family protein [Candidatus Saccharimonadales bacterium]|nr:thermonuclease family protein [Candidatus Saccharimonadales bacterium]